MMTLPGQNPETKTMMLVVEENRQRLKQLRLKGKLTKDTLLECLDMFTLNLSPLAWYQQALLETAVNRVDWNEILDKVNAI